MIDAAMVQELRSRTGAGIVDCKNALVEAGGDREKAIEVLKQKGAIKAAKKQAERQAHEGVIASYIHHNGTLAALVELACETDFVARNEEFRQLAQDLALQVAAMDPQFVSPETIPREVEDAKRQEFLAELVGDQKSEEIKAKIVEGKMQKWHADVCLTKQAFIKDEERTIEHMLNGIVAKIGEKIVPTRFVRMQMGK